MRLLSLEVSNYRTLEDVTLQFPNYYTAICGKNNSGKSNVIRVMRFLFGSPEAFPFADEIEITTKSDFPAWKKNDGVKDAITIKCKLEVHREWDRGLVEFVDRIAGSSKTESHSGDRDSEITIPLAIAISLTSETKVWKPTVAVGDRFLDEVASEEVWKRLRAGTMVVFHNSASSNLSYFARHRPMHGIVSRMNDVDRNKLKAKANTVKEEMDRLLESHRSELGAMLGRLDERFDVRLAAPEFDFEEWPSEISLGYRGFHVPLDDWGSGTRNQTLILKSVFDAKRMADSTTVSDRITPIVLIEEPESFLHPLAQAHFGSVLQDLSHELHIQVVATTHSPYLLSHQHTSGNILLARKVGSSNVPSASYVVPTADDNWKQPFEHALGVVGPEFDVFKQAVFSRSSALIMVEGETDKGYLELCRQVEHGDNALVGDGEIFAYGGWSSLTNNVLMKFIRDRFSRVVVTFDLDAERDVAPKLDGLGFAKNLSYFCVGEDQAGQRCIEGLIPAAIRQRVQAANPTLVDSLTSNMKEERENGKKELKKKYFEEFQRSASIPNGDYQGLYKVCKNLNRALARKTS
jgi:energy-coupling factor transporter ATP-binding protein EcfA2